MEVRKIMKVKLLFTFCFLMLFSISCSSSENEDTSQDLARGVLQSTTVLIQTSETFSLDHVSVSDLEDCFIRRILSSKCIEKKVPLNIWPEMEETLTNYSNGGGKEQFCSLNGFKHEPGVPFEIGAKVEIIALSSNDCQRTMLMRPGSPILKLPTFLVKVRVLDGKNKGLEGWTWAGAVKKE